MSYERFNPAPGVIIAKTLPESDEDQGFLMAKAVKPNVGEIVALGPDFSAEFAEVGDFVCFTPPVMALTEEYVAIREKQMVYVSDKADIKEIFG